MAALDGRLVQVTGPTVPPGAEGTMLTVPEVAKFLAVQEQTLRSWCAKKAIPHGKVGGAIRFDRDQLQAWLDQRWNGDGIG